jgi:hypothetical protein
MNFISPPADSMEVSGGDEHDGQGARYFRRTERGIKVRVDIAGLAGRCGSAIRTRSPLGRKLAFMPSEVITAGSLRRPPIAELLRQDS